MPMLRTVVLALVALGTAAPAVAQVDLSGTWATRNHEDWMERWPGPDVGDFSGLPINEDALARALAYSPSQLALPQRQCLYYGPTYTAIGPFGLRIWAESEPVDGQVVSWHMSGAVDKTPRTIWMDGRPHPSPNAVKTFGGFSTGEWEDDTLVVTTTHMKAGPLRRNGVPHSDRVVMTEYISRYEDKLTILTLIDDPVYMDEPHAVSRTYQEDPTMNLRVYPQPCVPGVEAPGLAADEVPHYLPGENPFEGEFSERYGLPMDAVHGGAETLYPDYRDGLEELYNRPAECGRYCCGWDGGNTGNDGSSRQGLACITREPPR